MPDFLLPDLGEGLEEAEVTAILRDNALALFPALRGSD